MSLVIDIVSVIDEELLAKLRRRITDMVDVHQPGLLFVRIRAVHGNELPPSAPAKVLYRITLCGVGGVTLPDVREFHLFQYAGEEQLQLQWIQKSSG